MLPLVNVLAKVRRVRSYEKKRLTNHISEHNRRRAKKANDIRLGSERKRKNNNNGSIINANYFRLGLIVNGIFLDSREKKISYYLKQDFLLLALLSISATIMECRYSLIMMTLEDSEDFHLSRKLKKKLLMK